MFAVSCSFSMTPSSPCSIYIIAVCIICGIFCAFFLNPLGFHCRYKFPNCMDRKPYKTGEDRLMQQIIHNLGNFSYCFPVWSSECMFSASSQRLVVLDCCTILFCRATGENQNIKCRASNKWLVLKCHKGSASCKNWGAVLPNANHFPGSLLEQLYFW